MKKQKRINYLWLFLFGMLFLSACQSALDDYYEQPSGVGKSILEGLEEDGNFTMFLSAIHKLEEEKSLQYSLITVMAPPDDIFKQFLNDHGYSSVDDIPMDTLKYIIEFHLIDWPHASGDLRSNSQFFKRKTRSAKPEEVVTDDEGNVIHYVNYPKYLQFFYPEFFDFYGGESEVDYKYLTGKDFIDLHVYDAHITKADWRFANGWVQVVDKVLVPPLNLAHWMEQHDEYSLHRSLIKRFNDVQRDGSGVHHGNDKDGNKLYCRANNLIPKVNWMVGFWPDYEGIGNFGDAAAPALRNKEDLTLIMSSNDALGSFMDEYFVKYADVYGANYIDSIPDQIIREVLYPTSFEHIILPSEIINHTAYNSELQTITVDIQASDATHALLSNAIVYGVNEFQLPRVFQGVSRPLLTYPEYSMFAVAAQKLGILSSLRDKDLEFTVFAPTNDIFEAQDITYEELWDDVNNRLVKFYRHGVEIPTVELADMIYSHILFGNVDIKPQTQFYKCYGGWYVAVNDTACWSGGNVTYPKLLDKVESPVVDNGKVFKIDDFVIKNLNTIGAEIYNRPEFSKFKELCEKVDFFDPNTKALKFIIYPYRYSAFIPSNDVLEQMSDSIPEDLVELENFIKYHFVRGDIFSDGKVSGTIETAYLDEDNSTDYKEVYFTADVINSLGDLKVKGLGNDAPLETTKDTHSNIICFDGVVHTINGILKY